MDDVIQLQNRMQAIKNRHKQQRGLVGKEDLEAVRQRELTRNELGIAAELERLKRKEGIGQQR